jgi:hypothetical protein
MYVIFVCDARKVSGSRCTLVPSVSTPSKYITITKTLPYTRREAAYYAEDMISTTGSFFYCQDFMFHVASQ